MGRATKLNEGEEPVKNSYIGLAQFSENHEAEIPLDYYDFSVNRFDGYLIIEADASKPFSADPNLQGMEYSGSQSDREQLQSDLKREVDTIKRSKEYRDMDDHADWAEDMRRWVGQGWEYGMKCGTPDPGNEPSRPDRDKWYAGYIKEKDYPEGYPAVMNLPRAIYEGLGHVGSDVQFLGGFRDLNNFQNQFAGQHPDDVLARYPAEQD